MKFILTIVASMMLLTTAYAQVATGEIRKLPAYLACGSVKNIESKIKEYREIALLQGVAAIDIPNGGMIQGDMKMFANPDTQTFTVVYYFRPPFVPNAMGVEACMQSAGYGMEPAMRGVGI